MAELSSPPETGLFHPQPELTGADGRGSALQSRVAAPRTIEDRTDTVARPAPRPSRATALRIAVWGGVGGGVGRVVWESTFEKGGLVDWGLAKWVGFVLAVSAVVFWEMRIKPPLKARLSGESSSDSPPSARAARATLVATLQALVFVIVVAMTLQMVLGPLRHDPSAFLRRVLAMTAICGGITYFWVRWAQRSLLGAVLSGFLSGVIISYLATLLDLFFWPGEYKIPNNRLLSTFLSWQLHQQVGLNALAWGSWGLMGALAINRKWGPCPSMGILAGTLVLDPVWMLVAWAWFGQAFLQKATLALLLLGTFRTVGWSMGLYIGPDADKTLDRSPMDRSRRGMLLFWGLGSVAMLLYAVLIVVLRTTSAPRPV